MKNHKVTPKKLLRRVTQPSPYEKNDWPVETYRAFRAAVDVIDTPSKQTGEWLPVTRHEPAKADLVRHVQHGEGQTYGSASLGRYLCSFAGENGSFEVECAADKLEVFRYFYSRADRIAAAERARAWFFR